jgi:hypothetical protein
VVNEKMVVGRVKSLQIFFPLKTGILAGQQWLTPAILATYEAEVRRIMISGQLWEKS